MNEVCLQFISDTSSKFYRLLWPANSLEVCTERGRIRGHVVVKWDAFDTLEAARTFFERKAREKRRKGYTEAAADDVLPANYHLYGVKREKGKARRAKEKPPGEGRQLRLWD